MDKRVLGKLGEKAAQEYIKSYGYKIIDVNFKNRYGEIDIIAKDKEFIVFIEVKSRTSIKYGLPCEAVNYTKQNKIKNTALYFIQNNKIRFSKMRFDVIEVYFNNDIVKDIRLIKNAF